MQVLYCIVLFCLYTTNNIVNCIVAIINDAITLAIILFLNNSLPSFELYCRQFTLFLVSFIKSGIIKIETHININSVIPNIKLW